LTSKGDVEGGIGGFIEAVSKEGEFNSPPGHVWVKFHGLNENFLLPIAATLSVRVGVYGKGIVRNTKSGQLLCDFEACEAPEGLEVAETAERVGTSPEPSLLLSPQPPTKPPQLSVVDPQCVLSPGFNIRMDPNDLEIADLTCSMKQTGLLQPILVRRKLDGSLERVAGSRRLRAAKDANLTSVPVIVTEMSDADAFVAQLIENLHRKDLTDEEKGRAFKHALETFPDKFPNQGALAKALGKKDPAWISHHIDVPEMADDLREEGVRVVPGQLTERQVRELKQLKPEERKRLIEKSEELPSSREIEEEADKPRKAAPPAATGRPREPAKPTGQFFHCKECGAALTVIHKSKTRHLLKSVREFD